MGQIQISHMSFAYPGKSEAVFSDVSLSLDTNWKLGLIGRNGRGKTTLLKILLGALECEGSVSSPIGFEYYPFLLGTSSEGESALKAMRAAGCTAQEWEIEKELGLLGLKEGALYQEFGQLSYGERAKIGFSCLFLKETKFLLIDEPTNHLDLPSRDAVASYLARKSGFILVSHDRSFLNASIDHVLSINKATIELQKGNFDSWQQNRDWQDSNDMALNAKLKGEIARLEAASRRAAGWSDAVERTRYGTGGDRGYIGHKSAKMMKRAKAVEQRRDRAIKDKESLMRDVEVMQRLQMAPLPFHSETLCRARGLSVTYGGASALRPTDFDMKRGECLALFGPNGCGKSTLLKIVSGQAIPFSGDFWMAKGVTVSYVSQDASFLKGSLRSWAAQAGVSETILMTSLDKLGFNRSAFGTALEELSEGERKKAMIASSLSLPAHLYIWDEPLNYLDVYTRVAIENLLIETRPTMILVEHDRSFLESVATEILSMEGSAR